MAATKTTPSGRKGDKVWKDAISAALRQEPNKLKKLAEKLISEAEAGNMQALKEIGDRLDGKPTQQLDLGGVDGEPIRTSLTIGFLDTVPEEAPTAIPAQEV